MSDKHARTLTQPSNRAKAKDALEKKMVFKSALASPYLVQWPSVPLNLQNDILGHLVQALEGASDYRAAQSRLVRKRKRSVRVAERQAKKRKSDRMGQGQLDNEGSTVTNNDVVPQERTTECISEMPDPRPPAVLRHVVHGLNEVTKKLENQVQALRRPILVADSKPSSPTFLGTVFVCRADVDPALLTDHLPHLVAFCNSGNPAALVKIVPLPRGSEMTLARVLGVRRVTVLAIDREFAVDQNLQSLLDRVPDLSAPWLLKKAPTSTLIETHVRHIRTTAPKDMKAAKELRTLEKSEAKRKKKLIKGS
ncbi:hypothetical protein CVT26_009803 [Gymnopilus dilepis]|uniref:Ribosomal protein L7Ae/L30e/S12e/Gadd45 domain-containing protein n=1 Tax=Gymnopilus dilepis TaxID=231916 RepID=A0A409YI88_9AGAR|nr:hypothetical protein CVT26_009803 [Gymnopilus dilepis]